jgi:hypothetical protein
VSGQAAVEQAKTAARLRDATSQLDVAAAQQAVVDGNQGRLTADGMRLLAGRTFRLVSGVWTDTAHTAQSRIVAVEPFSAAYFKLQERLPELTPYLSAFETVIVRGRDVSISVAAGGKATLTANEMETLVRDFRSR